MTATIPQYKFKVGESVKFAAVNQRPSGMFAIVRTMPAERGINQYRVKSLADGHERVAQEYELV